MNKDPQSLDLINLFIFLFLIVLRFNYEFFDFYELPSFVYVFQMDHLFGLVNMHQLNFFFVLMDYV